MKYLPKDEKYWIAIKKLKELDADIKNEETIIINLKHLRTEQFNRIIQSQNWIVDIDPLDIDPCGK
jgi:hypothetical protein